jgi:hypothetical protein
MKNIFNFTNTQNLRIKYKNDNYRGFSGKEMCQFLNIPYEMGLEYNASRSNLGVKNYYNNHKLKEKND